MANLWGTFGTSTINVVGSGTTATTTTSAGTTSQDRINIGFGPRLNPLPTDTSGFTFTGQPITPEEYQSRKVDFTKEFLDASLLGLGQQTGIDPTTTPAVGEDITLSGEDEDDSTDLGNILGDTYSTAFQTVDPVTGETTVNKKESQNKFGYNEVGKTDFNSYADYLKSSGNLDRVNLVEKVFDPIFGSAPLSDFSFEGFTKTAQQAPTEAGKSLTETLQGKDVGKKFMAGAITGIAPFPMNILGGIVGGEVRQNHFGESSLRPSGFGGLLYDLSMSAKFGAMSEIRAANEAASLDPTGGPFDTGFATKIGGMSALRRPGSNSYLNDTGLSHQQLKNIEAFSKGYMVDTYTFDEKPGKNIFGQETNQKVEDVGGMYAGQGYYTPDGKYYSGKYQQLSAAGPESAIFDGARKAGVPKDVFKDAVMDARKGKGTVQDNIKAYKDQKAAEEKAAREAAEAAEAAAAAAAAAKSRGGGSSPYANDNGGFGGYETSGSYDAGGYSTGDYSGSGGRETGGGGFTEGGAFSGLAAGGTVGMAAGGAMAAGSSGFIGAPPSQVPEEKTVADDQLTEYPEGTFIINAAAVEEAGEADIIKMLNDAEKEAVRRGIAIDKSGNSAKLIDVAVSQGEVKVAPYLAKIIGYDRLRKINNRGKPEVAERQREASSGGFI